MSTNSGDALERAYELIETNRLDEAKAVLKPILETEKDNPDAWWLYAHAVDDPETARIALNNVLRLDSSYPEAKNLLKKLDQGALDADTFESGTAFHKEPSFLPSAPPTLPGLSKAPPIDDDDDDIDFSDDFDDEEEEEESQFSRRGVIIAAIIGALLLVGALAIVIIRPFANQPNATASPRATSPVVVLDPTVETTPVDISSIPTATPITAPSQESSLTLTEDTTTSLVSVLEAFDVLPANLAIATTDLGDTLVVDVCSQQGSELREKLPQVMETLANNHELYESVAQAVGARMVDCETNSPLIALGVPLSDAVDYADGTLDSEQFQAKWKPIG